MAASPNGRRTPRKRQATDAPPASELPTLAFFMPRSVSTGAHVATPPVSLRQNLIAAARTPGLSSSTDSPPTGGSTPCEWTDAATPQPQQPQTQWRERVRSGAAETAEFDVEDDFVLLESSGHSSANGSPQTAPDDSAAWLFRLKSSELCMDQNMSPVAAYVMDVRHNGAEWEIVRRFNQFYELDVQLHYHLKSDHKVQLPKLPRKYLFKSSADPLIVKSRTTLLQKYISELGANPLVTSTDVWQEWVAEANPLRLYRLSQPLLSGSLTRQRAMRSGKRCFCVLTSELLVSYDGDRPQSTFQLPTKFIALAGASVKVTKDPKAFVVTAAKNSSSWTLEAEHADEATAWVTFIRSAIQIGTSNKTAAAAEAEAAAAPAAADTGDAAATSTPSAQRRAEQGVGPVSRSAAASPIKAGSKEGWESGVIRRASRERPPVLARMSLQATPTTASGQPSLVTIGTYPLAQQSSTTKRTEGDFALDGNMAGSAAAGTGTGAQPATTAAAQAAQAARPRTASAGVEGAARTRAGSDPTAALPEAPGKTLSSGSLKDLMRMQGAAGAFTEQRSRPRGATLMVPAEKDKQLDRAALVLQHLRQQKMRVDKELESILNRFQLDQALCTQHKQPESAVVPQLAALTRTILRATPEQLLTSTLCKDTIIRIRALGRHPLTSKLLFSLSQLSRPVDAHQSSVAASHAPAAVPLPLLRGARGPASATASPLIHPDTGQHQQPAVDSPPPQIRLQSNQQQQQQQQQKLQQQQQKQDAMALPPPLIRQPLGELHTEAAAPNPRPPRRGGRTRSSGRLAEQLEGAGVEHGEDKQAKSLRLAVKKLMCRICEDEYPRSVMKEHTTYCVRAAKADPKGAHCNVRIANILKLLEEHRQSTPTAAYQSEAYRTVAKIGQRVAALQYGSEAEQRECWDKLSALQSLLADLSYNDVGLMTYARRLSSVIEEKWANMKQYARMQRELAADSDGARKKPINFWGLLSLKSHLRRTTTGPPPDEVLLQSTSSVSIEDFEILKRISSGAYGKVYLARKKKTRDLFAVKVQNKSDLLRKNMVDNAIAERLILSNVKAPFVVKLYYAFQNERALYLVMEYCCGGDVATLLRNLGAFDLDMARAYAADTVLSLESLHRMSYIHRDLKPDNLLINEKGHLLLTDFGLSSIGVLEEQSSSSASSSASSSTASSAKTSSSASSSSTAAAAALTAATAAVASGRGSSGQKQQQQQQQQQQRIVGTPDYLAPEMLLGTGHGPEVDWWALGVMIYEFLAGVPPFNADTPEDIFDRILRRDIVWPDEFDDVTRDIIDKLLNPDATQRLGHNGPDEVKAHPFFAGIDWARLPQESREDIFVPQLDNPEDTSYHEDHRQTKGGASITAAQPPPAQTDFKGFEFTNTDSLEERTLLLATEEDEDEEENSSSSSNSPNKDRE